MPVVVVVAEAAPVVVTGVDVVCDDVVLAVAVVAPEVVLEAVVVAVVDV